MRGLETAYPAESQEATDVDGPSIEELSRHQAFLQWLARDLVRDPATADDLVQEAFIAFARRRHEVDEPRSWLAGVLRNLSRQERRSRRRRERRESLASPPTGVTPAEDVLATEELRQQLVTAVVALGEPYASTLFHRYWDELTPTEIADRTNLPLDTVKTRLRRGLALLRERLDREYGERRAWATAFVALTTRSGPAAPVPPGMPPIGWGGLLMSAQKVAGILVTISLLVGLWAFWPDRRSSEDPPQTVAGQPQRETTTESSDPIAGADASKSSRSAPPHLPGHGIRVVDRETRSPIAGARVALRSTHSRTELGRVHTDGSGLAEIPPTSADRVQVSAPGYVPIDQPLIVADPPHEISISRGLTWSGRVVDEAGHAVSHARILQPLDPQWFQPSRDVYSASRLAELPVDDDGRFETAYRDAATLLAVLAVGFEPRWVAPGRDDAPIVLRGAEERTARVVDLAGQPIADARVTVALRPDASFEDLTDCELLVSGVTDAAGSVALPASHVLWMRLTVEHPAHRSFVLEVTEDTDRPEWPESITLESLTLVRGRVVDESGLPPSGDVSFQSTLGSQPMSVDGTGALLEFRPHSLVGEIRADGFLPYEVDWTRAGRSDVIEAGEIVLAPSRELRVRVTSAAGDPIPGAELRVTDRGQYPDLPSAVTDLQGEARLVGISAFEVTLAAGASGWLGATRKVALIDRVTTLDLVFEPCAWATGRVRAADAETAPMAEVRLVGEFDFNANSLIVWTDPAGLFSIAVPASGDVTVAITAPEHSEVTVPLPERRAGETIDLGKIDLDRGARIHGQVVDARGRPVVGATVGISSRSGLTSTVETDDEGRYSLHTSGELGPMLVIIRPAEWMGTHERAQLEQQLRWAAGVGSQEANFVVPDSVDYSGRVVTASGEPVVGRTVELLSHVSLGRPGQRVSFHSRVETDDSGWFSFEAVPDVECSVSVETLPRFSIDSARVSELPTEIQLVGISTLVVRLRPNHGALPRQALYRLGGGGSSGTFGGAVPIIESTVRFDGVRVGPGLLSLEIRGFAPVFIEFEADERELVVDVDVVRAADGILVEVTDSAGRSIPAATVRVSSRFGRTSLVGGGKYTADNRGRVRVETPHAHAILEVHADGFADRVVEDFVAEAKAGRFRVELTRASTLTVSVRSADGSSVEGLRVGYCALSPGVPMRLTLGTRAGQLEPVPVEDGLARIGDLVAARYRVMLYRGDVQLTQVEVDVPVEADHAIDVEVPVWAVVSGRVEVDGRPVTGGTLRISPATTEVRADGTFEFDAPVGLRTVRYGHPDGQLSMSWPRIVAPDEPLVLEITDVAVRGRVVDERGLPVGGLSMTLSGDGGGRELTTDAEGRFDAGSLASGVYRAKVDRRNASESRDRALEFALGSLTIERDRPLDLSVVPAQWVRLEVTMPESERGHLAQLAARAADGSWHRIDRCDTGNGSGFWCPEGTSVVQVSTSAHAPVVVRVDARTEVTTVDLTQPGGRFFAVALTSGTLRIEREGGGAPLPPALSERRVSSGTFSVSLPVGRFRIDWRPDSGEPRHAQVEIGAGSTVRVEL